MTGTLLQSLVVYALVACCAVYAAWVLSPAALKRFVANVLMARSRRLSTSRRLQALARQEGGCGTACSGCADPARPSVAKPPKIWIVRRR